MQIFYDTYFSERVCKLAGGRASERAATIDSKQKSQRKNLQLRNDSRAHLDWPTMKFFENKMFLPTNFYGVQLDDAASGFDRILSFDTVHLIFYASGTENVRFLSAKKASMRARFQHTAEIVGDALEIALREALADRSAMLRSSMFSLSILKAEMTKNTTYTLPYV